MRNFMANLTTGILVVGTGALAVAAAYATTTIVVEEYMLTAILYGQRQDGIIERTPGKARSIRILAPAKAQGQEGEGSDRE